MRVKKGPMSQIALYPLRFEPIYQYRLWGGRRLAGPEKFIEIAWIQRWKDSEKVNCF